MILTTKEKTNPTTSSSSIKTFYETDEFPFLKIFDDNYEKILEELKSIIQEEKILDEQLEKSTNEEEKKQKRFFELWCESELYDESNPEGWIVAPFMINYQKDEFRCKKAPFLMSLVEKSPWIITISYSMLKPGTWIVPHKGYENYADVLLRYHLGLIVPKGDLGIRVEKSVKTWEDGKSWVFDDALTHEAWNFSDQDRYVLIVDFTKTPEKKEQEKIRFDICSLTNEAKKFVGSG